MVNTLNNIKHTLFPGSVLDWTKALRQPCDLSRHQTEAWHWLLWIPSLGVAFASSVSGARAALRSTWKSTSAAWPDVAGEGGGWRASALWMFRGLAAERQGKESLPPYAWERHPNLSWRGSPCAPAHGSENLQEPCEEIVSQQTGAKVFFGWFLLQNGKHLTPMTNDVNQVNPWKMHLIQTNWLLGSNIFCLSPRPRSWSVLSIFLGGLA